VKKNLWLFLIKLAFFTIVFGLVWFWVAQDLYPRLLKPVIFPFFKLVGVRKWRLSILLDHFTNIVPYVTLVCATPGFFKRWKKTILVLIGGLLILAIGHILLSWLDYYYWSQYGTTRPFFRNIFHFYLLNDALPLALWLIFYPRMLGEIFGFLKFGKAAKGEKTAKEESIQQNQTQGGI
jgi:hypothetical protein